MTGVGLLPSTQRTGSPGYDGAGHIVLLTSREIEETDEIGGGAEHEADETVSAEVCVHLGGEAPMTMHRW